MKAAYVSISLWVAVLMHGNAVKATELWKTPEMSSRISRQAGRYGHLGAYGVRSGAGNNAGASGMGQAVFRKPTRPLGALSAGVANGARPAYGASNIEGTVVASAGRQPPLGVLYNGQAPALRQKQNVVYRGTAGRIGPGVYQG